MNKDAIISDLQTKHFEVFEVADENSPFGLVIVRKLSKLEYRRWKEQRDDDGRKHLADEFVAATCIVYPDAVATQQLIDNYPVFASSVLGEVFKISGAVNLSAKKL